MTKEEFIKRTGYTPATQEEYEAIEQMYMHAGNMDKDEFCKEWKKLHESSLFREIYCKMKSLDKKAEKQGKIISEMADRCLGLAEGIDDQKCDPYRMAIGMIGQHEVVRRKLAKGYQLNEADKQYLLSVVL